MLVTNEQNHAGLCSRALHVSDGDFLKSIHTTKTITTITSRATEIKSQSCAIGEQYLLADEMIETTGCDSGAPSLQQEMNLARRACWCRGHNCCCEVAVMEAAAEDGAGKNVDNEVTTVLNGATFRKITNKIHKPNSNYNNVNAKINANGNANANANDDNDNDNYNANGGDYADSGYEVDDNDGNGEGAPSDAVDTSGANSYLISGSSEMLATINLHQSRVLIKRKKATGKPTTSNVDVSSTPSTPNSVNVKDAVATNNTSDKDDAFPAIPQTKTETEIPARQLLAHARAQFVCLWLAFVAFCNAVTIKRDDPRFAEDRRREAQEQQQQRQRHQAPREQREADRKASDATENVKPAARFKLLTSKKLIFLFLVCVFFSCVNRIEGRPNTSAVNNAVEDASAAVTADVPVHATTVAAITAAGANEVTPARLTVAGSSSNDGSSAALPTKSNAISTDSAADDSPSQSENRPVIVISAHDDDDIHEHKPERYPLSQVDFDRVNTPFIIGIWILSASIAKIGFHMTPKLHLIFPESCLLIVVGVVIGVMLYFCSEVAVSPLTPNTFFFYMLPPIILDAGYFMPNRMFFDNLGTILLMAVVGTIFNIATIGTSLWACGLTGIYGAENTPRFLDIFLFASLISAVDPVAVLAVFEEIHVNEILYIVVFGESLLNDAVTVVMYHMMEVYNEIGISNIIPQDIVSGVGSFFVVAIGGTVIGIIWGILTGLVTRFTDHVRVIEPIFIFVMAYLAYLNAEIFHMSGILAITFCGITMKNYVESNISQKSHTTVKYALKMLSSSSETIIFMFLGVATVNNNHVWNTAFVLLTIAFCSVFRVIGVVILSALANRFRLHKLSRVDQFVMSYGGLRGAVAFALVLLCDERVVKQKDMFVTTTIAVIYFTVFVQGITIKPLVTILNVKRASKKKPTMNERIHERFMDHLMAGIEDIVGKTGNYNVRDKFKRFDNRFIRPLLIRDLKGAEPKIIETYSKLTMRDAMEVMRRNPSTIGQITATESMSALFRNYTNNCIGGSPSLTNLDNSCSRNLDMHELDYNPSKKDLTDAKIHHLLAEELKPYRRASVQMHRRLSYSRHAVDDRDLSTQVNYKMQMNFRRMFNDRKHHKRSKRGANKQQEGVKQNHVSFHDFQQNGTTKQFTHDYINDVLNESAEENPSKLDEVTVVGANDDWDDGLTFTAKSSPDSDLANNNSLIAHIQNLPGFDASKARIVQHYASKSNSSPEKLLTPDVGPTAAELILPWRRDRSYQCIVAENPIPEEERTFSRESDGERRVATPTATESQLPWKRQGDELTDAVQQNEFPAWASNKEYLAYNSPSATFLGGINKPKQPKSVIGLFRRESSGSKGGSLGGGDAADGSGSARGSDPTLVASLGLGVMPIQTPMYGNPRLDKRSQSISAASGSSGPGAGISMGVGEGHAGPFPVTASHRRNVRRGSMLELSGDIIPEETYQHGHSKSLCEPADDDDWDSAALAAHQRADSASTNSEKLLRSGREPLLPKLTPRAQIRRMGGGVGGAGGSKSQVTTALLSTSNSEYDDDEDEDFDLYDDENIVVTTLTAAGGNGSGKSRSGGTGNGGGSGSGGNTTTTTTIRLTRNNDESII